MSVMAINSLNNQYDISIFSQIVSQQQGAKKISGQDQESIAKFLEGIAINKKIENMQTLQYMAAYLVSAEINVEEEIEAAAEKKAQEAQEDAQEDTEAQSAEKTAENKNISETIKHFLYKSLTKVDGKLSNLMNFNPVALVDIENGKDIDYSALRLNAVKSYGDAFVDYFKQIPDIISKDLSHLLKYIGCTSSKALGRDYLNFTNSIMSGINKSVNTVREGVGTFVDTIDDLDAKEVNNNKTDMTSSELDKYTYALSDKYESIDAAQNCKDLAASTVTDATYLIDGHKKGLSKLADYVFKTLNYA